MIKSDNKMAGGLRLNAARLPFNRCRYYKEKRRPLSCASWFGTNNNAL